VEITYFDSPEEAERKLRKKEIEHLIVDHALEAGDKVELDFHASNEWVIFGPGSGRFEFYIHGEERRIKLDQVKTTVIFIPKGKVHSLWASSDLFYTVLRDGLK
jgi:hypothetical protein